MYDEWRNYKIILKQHWTFALKSGDCNFIKLQKEHQVYYLLSSTKGKE